MGVFHIGNIVFNPLQAVSGWSFFASIPCKKPPSHPMPLLQWRASSSDVSCCCFLLMPFPFYYNVDLLLMQKGKQKITHPSLEFICLWCTLWPGMGPPHNYYVLCNPNAFLTVYFCMPLSLAKLFPGSWLGTAIKSILCLCNQTQFHGSGSVTVLRQSQ